MRADLADLEGPPTSADLALDPARACRRGPALPRDGRQAAAPWSPRPAPPSASAAASSLGRDRRLEEVGGRMRIDARARCAGCATGAGRGASSSRSSRCRPTRCATRRRCTLGVGALAAASLLGVAIVLVRREARRNAEERERERERRLASLGEMSAVLAHEIRNPLASLKGNAQLLAAMLPDGEKPRAKAERVVDEAVRLEQLTNDLLAVRAHRRAAARAPIDPAALVREAAASVSRRDRGRHRARARRRGRSTPARIREVLVNLRRQRGRRRAAGARRRCAPRAGRLVIEVADRGPGRPRGGPRARSSSRSSPARRRAPASGSRSRGASSSCTAARIAVHDAPRRRRAVPRRDSGGS